MDTTQIVFPPFRLDLSSERLVRGRHPLPLTPKAFAVLRVLVGHAGRLVTKEEILDTVWAGTHVRDAVLKVCVREIRMALRDEADRPRFIETVHRRGYRFIGRLDGHQAAPVDLPDDETAAATRSAPTAARHEGFVGRDEELGRLRGWLERAMAGERQVAFVTGEPGIGKTAVMEVFLERATAGREVWVARGKCLEQFGAGEAYLPVLEALTRLAREAGGRRLVAHLRRHAPTWLIQMPSLIGDAERQILQREIIGATSERMLREMAEAIEALTAEIPLVLALDDLHWSDYSTLDLIAALARRREPARLMILGTYREAEVLQAHHPLRAVKQELQMRRQCHEVALGYLCEEMVERFLDLRFPGVTQAAELARAIHRRTDGNPLFMVHVVDYLASRDMLRPSGSGNRPDPPSAGAGPGPAAAGDGAAAGLQVALAELETGIPESLRRMIDQQVERLSADEQAVLASASISGIDFSPIAVAAGLETDAPRVEAVCEALAARGLFLRATGARRLPDGTVSARFAFVHPLYLNVLYDRIPPARRLRMHQRIAERGIAVYGDRVGEIAAELAMHFEQARDYAAAVLHLRQAADNAARRYANREAIGHLTHAFDLVGRLPEAGRGALQMAILERCATVRRAMGNMRGAADDVEALIALAREQQRPDAESRGLFFLGSALAWFDRPRFEQVAGEAEALARRLRDPLLRAHTRGYAAYWNLLLRGWRDEDARASADALRRARRGGDRLLQSQHLGRHAYFECLRARYAAGCRGARDGMRLALEVGDGFDYLLCRFFLGWGLLHAGAWGEARRVLEEGIGMAEKNGHRLWATLLRLEMAWLHGLAYDFEEAGRLCEESLREARESRHAHAGCVSLVLRGAAHAGLGQAERAARCVAEAGDPADRERALMDWSWQMPLSLWLSDYWLARGDPVRARAEAQRVLDLAARPGERTYLALARRNLALLEEAAGRRRRAAIEIGAALRSLRGVDAPPAAWRVHAAAARILGARDRRVARRHGAEAAAHIRRLAGSLAPAPALRRTFLAAPKVQEALRTS